MPSLLLKARQEAIPMCKGNLCPQDTHGTSSTPLALPNPNRTFGRVGKQHRGVGAAHLEPRGASGRVGVPGQPDWARWWPWGAAGPCVQAQLGQVPQAPLWQRLWVLHGELDALRLSEHPPCSSASLRALSLFPPVCSGAAIPAPGWRCCRQLLCDCRKERMAP